MQLKICITMTDCNMFQIVFFPIKHFTTLRTGKIFKLHIVNLFLMSQKVIISFKIFVAIFKVTFKRSNFSMNFIYVPSDIILMCNASTTY